MRETGKVLMEEKESGKSYGGDGGGNDGGELEVVESWKDAGGSRSGRGEGDRVKNGGGLEEVMEER